MALKVCGASIWVGVFSSVCARWTLSGNKYVHLLHIYLSIFGTTPFLLSSTYTNEYFFHIWFAVTTVPSIDTVRRFFHAQWFFHGSKSRHIHFAVAKFKFAVMFLLVLKHWSNLEMFIWSVSINSWEHLLLFFVTCLLKCCILFFPEMQNDWMYVKLSYDVISFENIISWRYDIF